MSEKKLLPKLRFSGFDDEWNINKLNEISTLTSSKRIYSSDYVETGIPFYRGAEITQLKNNEEIKEKLFISTEKYNELKNKFGAPKKDDILVTGVGTLGNVYKIRDNAEFYFKDGNLIWIKDITINPDFLELYLETFKNEMLKLAIGSTQKALTIVSLEKLKVKYPNIQEQRKIANFFEVLDNKIRLLSKKYNYYIDFKKYLMQQIFALKLRFKDDNNENFDDWKERKLSEFLTEHKLKSTGKEEVYSVSVHKGLVNQVEHLGRAFSAPDTSKYNLVKPGDIVYTKSPTGDFPLGIIKQSRVDKNVIVSPLYGVFTPETYDLGYILNDYFESNVNTHNYLHPIVQKGAKNTMNITNKTFLSKSLFVPTDKEEQHKIAGCLMKFNENITLIEMQKNQVEDFKHGLLQQMFV